MKILLIHNFYQSSSPSGEDGVFAAERNLLEEKRTDAITFTKYNDDMQTFSNYKKITLPFQPLWSVQTLHQLKSLIKKTNPDLAHFHNIWYLISPSAYYACKNAGISIVQTLHNFRFFCSNGLLMRNGRVCEECIGKIPWRGFVYGCYGSSRLYSMPIALAESFHRYMGTWRENIDAYIALTEFGKRKFIECGLPEEKIFVKPNFLPNPLEPQYSNDSYAVFLGRLTAEKGLNILVDAFRNHQFLTNDPFTLRIIGDGPLRKQIERKIEHEKIANVELAGRRNPNDCMDFLKGARFMVIPSICYETFSLTAIEAFACGKPVIASRLGALAELVEDGKTGLLFEPGNPEDLASKIKWMLENESACIEMGKNARRVFEEKYTAEKNYEILMKIYHTVLSSH